MKNEITNKNSTYIQKKNTILKTIEVLNKSKINYFVEGGLFLGVVRNNSFIPWDWDFEFAVFYEEISKKPLEILGLFVKKGFKILSVNLYKENFKINVSLYSGIKVSILSYYLSHNYRKRWIFQFPSYFFKKKNYISFLGKRIRSPHIDYLKFKYGDWRKEIKSRNSDDYLTKLCTRRPFILKRISHKIKNFYFLKYIRAYRKLCSLIYGRENNFSYMIKKNLKPNTIFLDIGSNDGAETKIALNNDLSIKSTIFEPDKKNIIKIKNNLKKEKFKGRYKIINCCISNKNSTINFYKNLNSSNLNSIIKKDYMKKMTVKSKTLDLFLIKKKNQAPVFVKADIEGGEYKMLKGGLNFLLNNNNIQILLELHPNTYKDGKFKKIINILFKNGYRPKYVESAGKPIPDLFEKNKLKPFRIFNNRGLYKKVPIKFILDYAFNNSFSFTDYVKSGYSSKVIRSLLLSKNL